jgi:hypothetical protein
MVIAWWPGALLPLAVAVIVVLDGHTWPPREARIILSGSCLFLAFPAFPELPLGARITAFHLVDPHAIEMHATVHPAEPGSLGEGWQRQLKRHRSSQPAALLEQPQLAGQVPPPPQQQQQRQQRRQNEAAAAAAGQGLEAHSGGPGGGASAAASEPTAMAAAAPSRVAGGSSRSAALVALGLLSIPLPAGGADSDVVDAACVAFGEVERAAEALGLAPAAIDAVCGAVQAATEDGVACRRFLGMEYRRLVRACAAGDEKLARDWMARAGGSGGGGPACGAGGSSA